MNDTQAEKRELLDRAMRRAAHLYREHNWAGEACKAEILSMEGQIHKIVKYAETGGRFEGYFEALRELGYFSFNGYNETPYTALQQWLFKNGMMNGQQTLGGWAKSLGDPWKG